MAHPLRALAAVVALSLPACAFNNNADPEPNFGAEEMQALIVGTWTGTLTLQGKTSAMQLVLEHAPPGTSPACSNRTLGVDPACVDMTTLGVKGTLTTADGAYAASPVTGTFNVMGLELRGGFLELKLQDGKSLSAQHEGGGFTGCSVWADHGEAGSCTMSR